MLDQQPARAATRDLDSPSRQQAVARRTMLSVLDHYRDDNKERRHFLEKVRVNARNSYIVLQIELVENIIFLLPDFVL